MSCAFYNFLAVSAKYHVKCYDYIFKLFYEWTCPIKELNTYKICRPTFLGWPNVNHFTKNLSIIVVFNRYFDIDNIIRGY